MSSDYAARQEALTADQSYIVQAPAGSGKTGLLVYRMLTLLATVEKPQQVLAITFTRKATAEMRARVIGLMQAAQAGQQGDDAYQQQGLALAAVVLARDKDKGWNLINTPYQLQILTIDAFCARLTSNMPWLSRLGDRPRTTDNADEHYAAAVEQLFNVLLDSTSSTFDSLRMVMLELDFDYLRARQLFRSMLAKRDQWLRHLLRHELGAMRQQLQTSWQNVVDIQIDNVRQQLPTTTLERLVDLATDAAGNIEDTASTASPLAVFKEKSSAQSLGLVHWRGLAHLLLTNRSFRKRVDKRLGFLPKTDAKHRIEVLLKDLANDNELLNALLSVRDLPDPRFSDSDWSQLIALETVLKSLAALLQLRFRAANECDYSEVTQRANLALQELDNPTDLSLRLDYQLQHILVDEFQDTSQGQIELLKKLVAGWQPGDGKTLFLVGDPMQSIYRFREADVSLFLQVADNARTKVFDNISISALSLTENFRSSQQLVSWYNSTFGPSFPDRNNILTGAIRYRMATCSKDNRVSPAVDCRLAADRAQEAQWLATHVQQAVAELPTAADRVAILVRSRATLDALLPELRNAGIKYAGVDIQPLQELQAVIDVIALCKAICREDDRVAWLSLLRGPWCGLTLAQIKQVAGNQNDTVWQQLIGVDLSSLNNSATQRLKRFVATMRNVLAQRQQVSLGSLTRWAWQQLGGPDALAGASRDDIERVFELIETLQRGGDLPSINELDKALQGLFAQPSQPDAKVIVSTIHKAKGLQYHTVILPGLANVPRSSDKEVLMWAEYQNRDGEPRLLLAPFTLQQSSSSHYQYLRQLDRQRASNEAMRLMYVACTRAEHKLVLLARAKLNTQQDGVKAPPAASLLNTVWAPLHSSFDFIAGDTQPEVPPLTELPQRLVRLPASYQVNTATAIDWKVETQLNTQPVRQPDDIEYQWATQMATAVGIVLHDWLQYQRESVLQATVGPVLLARWRAQLLSLRVPENRLEQAITRLKTAARNIRQDRSAHFLFESHPEAHSEYTLSAFENGLVNHYRLDRTFVDADGMRWIVDYKSTDTNNPDVVSFVDEQVQTRHRAQLQKYAALFAQIDSRPIKLAVYFPLLKQLRVWDYQP